MKLEKYPVKKLKKEILEIMKRNLDINKYQVFFFGSRVKGDNFERADIDLGILGDKAVPVTAKFKIQDELERLPILYKIDLVDFSKVSSEFKKQSLKNIDYVK